MLYNIIQVVIVDQSLSHVWLCDPMDCSTLGFPVLHCLLGFAQTHVHWVGDAIQPSQPPLPPSPLVLSLFQYQVFSQSVGSSHQVAKILEFEPQHQPFHWIILPLKNPLGLTGLISLLSQGLSGVFSSTTIRKHQFFSAQPSFASLVAQW